MTGPVCSGKTTAVEKTLIKLEHQKRIKGFFTPRFFGEGVFSGYNLVNVESGERHPFIRLEGRLNWERIGKFYFIPEGLNEGNGIIQSGLDAEILIIDEVGPLELSGRGFRESVDACIGQFGGILLVVIRESLVENSLRTLNLPNRKVKIVRPENRGELLELLI